MLRLWVTGYRSYELNVFGEHDPKITIIKYALKQAFMQLLDEQQLDWIITGPNMGIEQWAAEVAGTLRANYGVRLAIMAPYENYTARWNETNQAAFVNRTKSADFFAATSNTPYQSPAQLKNYQRFMLQHTDQALMIYDPEHPGKPKFDYQSIQLYQEQAKKDYPLKLLDFYDLEDAAQEYQEQHPMQH